MRHYRGDDFSGRKNEALGHIRALAVCFCHDILRAYTLCPDSGRPAVLDDRDAGFSHGRMDTENAAGNARRSARRAVFQF